jgi:hypothetical protein
MTASMRATARRAGFNDSPISLSGVGHGLGMRSPYSLAAMAHQPAVITYDTGPISASTVSGRLALGIVSDGRWSYKGSLIDGAQLVGDWYEANMILNFTDSQGRMKAVTHSGELGSHIAGGSRRADWEEFGEDPFIRDNWDAIRATGFTASLSARDSAGQIFFLVGTSILVVAVGVSMIASGGKADSHWEVQPDGSPTLVVRPRVE